MVRRFLSIDLRENIRRVHLHSSLSKTNLFVFSFPPVENILLSFCQINTSVGVVIKCAILKPLSKLAADAASLQKYFEGSRNLTLDGLLIDDVLDVVQCRTVPLSSRFYGIRWIDYVKKKRWFTKAKISLGRIEL